MVYEAASRWRAVDEYFVDTLVEEDAALRASRLGSHEAGLPPHEVAPNQGALLSLLARMIGAARVLEIGTLAGYSTIWLARAVGPSGKVVTLELNASYADVAQRNLEKAGVAERVEVMVGPAVDALARLVEQGEEPFDVVFIDADKPNNPAYLQASLALTRRGSIIVADNVVRDGAVINADSADDRVQGVRRFLQMLSDEPRLEATAIQTVGSKGWDGFALAIVR